MTFWSWYILKNPYLNWLGSPRTHEQHVHYKESLLSGLGRDILEDKINDQRRVYCLVGITSSLQVNLWTKRLQFRGPSYYVSSGNNLWIKRQWVQNSMIFTNKLTATTNDWETIELIKIDNNLIKFWNFVANINIKFDHHTIVMDH